jgi:hypothetical protein
LVSIHQENVWNTRDAEVLRAFHDSFRKENCRRVISLPKKENITLPNNRQNAENRFRSLTTKLGKNAQLRSVYYTLMQDYVQRGQVEEVNPDEDQGKHSTYPTMQYPKADEETRNGGSCSTLPPTRRAPRP